MDKITITTIGEIENNGEHNTIIKNLNGEEKRFSTDGYEGVSFEDVKEILDFIGIEYFVVHKK